MTDATIKSWKSETGNRKLEIGNGFTLTELLVVIGIIVLIASIALPSVVRLFTAGADAQAHNVIAAQLAHARALAIQNNTYAGVHVQLADATDTTDPYSSSADLLNPDIEETCYVVVVIYDQAVGTFSLAPGCKPQKIPGSIAFGQINTSFVSAGNYVENALDTQSELDNFTTFTVVFSPSGQVVTSVAGGSVVLADTATTNLFGIAAPAIWNLSVANDAASSTGTTAITMFDYIELKNRGDNDRDNYLDEAGQFLPINVYTGQLFPRK